MKTFLGIDPGLSKTGYGIVSYDGSSYKCITYGVIETDRGLTSGKRLQLIYKKLKSIIAHYLPDEAAIETLYYAKNVKTALPVAEARGVILFTLAESEIPFREYSPLKVKLAVAGSGRADKHQIQEMVRMICRLPEVPQPDHAADALSIAICHINSEQFNEKIIEASSGHDSN